MSKPTSYASAAAAAAAANSSSSQEEQAEAQRIVQTYKVMRAQISELANKIAELDSDKSEHALVLRALTGLDPDRRCYRSIGGVLVERTIKEVYPAVEKNLKGIEEVITRLTSELKEKETAADEFRIKYNIQMGNPEDSRPASQNESKQREGGSGVLA